MIDDERQQAAQDRWLDDWIDGNLVEASGDDYYHAPIHRALEADGITHLAGMLEALRHKKYVHLLARTAKLLADLEDEIRKDAQK